jgi:uncharacterized protein YjcR
VPAPRKFDHEAAYQFWANQPSYCRSYTEVAEEFGVSDVAVGKTARRKKWHRRVRSKDIAAEGKLMRRVLSVRMGQFRSAIEAARIWRREGSDQ